MTFNKAIEILSAALVKRNPKFFTGTWVYQHAPCAYRFFRLNVRTPTGNIDWDAITRMLDPCLQYKWNGRRRRAKKPYENRAEVDLVLAKYKDKLYTVVTVMDDYDKRIRDRIIVVLVRIAQKGNITARQEAITYIRYTVDEWIEKYYVLQRWSGFGELLEEEIAACIRRYRFRRFLFCFFCIFQSMVRIDHATGDNKLGRCRRQSDVGKEYSCDKLDIYGHFFRIRIRPRFDHSFKWKSNS